MATYGTDLNVFNAADSAGSWAELSGHASGSSPAADTENYFQNSIAVSQGTGQATGTNAGMQCDFGSNITWTDGWVIIAWLYYSSPTNLNTWTNGGHRMGVGSTSGNMYYWKASGSDFGDLPKACWQNVAIDPNDPSGTTNSHLAADYTDGSPTSSKRYFGSLPNVLAKITKGSPHACDIVRYGRGEIYGTGTGGTFSGYATDNDGSTARWGLFEAIRGGYLWKGLFSFGQSGTSLTFSDSNVDIVLDDCPRVQSDFNKMQTLNASTSVTWTKVNIKGLTTSITGSAPVAPGEFDFSTGTIDINGGTFTNLGTWIFGSDTIDDATFDKCKSITSGASTFTNVVFNEANDTEAIAVADLDELDGCDFTIGTSGHAVELTGAATSYDWNCTASGYDVGTGGNGVEVTGGSITGDETIHITATTGTFTINVSAGATTPSVSSAGAIVNVVVNPVTITITVRDNATSSLIENARVKLTATSGLNFPYQASVSITSSGTTATVSHTAHGLATNDWVKIEGVTNGNEYNGSKQITVTGVNAYTYVLDSAQTSPATGTILATFMYFNTLTNASGVVTDTRSISSNQTVEGWVRKGSTSPKYIQASIDDTVNSTSGLTLNIRLVSDE